MTQVSRRSLIAGMAAASATVSSWSSLGFGASGPSAAVNIIDASIDTSSYIEFIEKMGVQVVARYLSRGCQANKWLMRKRIAFNPPRHVTEQCLENVIEDRRPEYELLLEKFALLSIYQFYNDRPTKFTEGLPDALPLANKELGRAHAAARAEARLDGDAALIQSRRMGQPDTTPIYFGVDFNMRPSGVVSDLKQKHKADAKKALDGCLAYFTMLKTIVGDRLGVYGNGYINRILRTEGLVRYSWVSESRSFEETPKFLREGFMLDGKRQEWHLFQHLINGVRPFVEEAAANKGTAKKKEPFEFDGNVHNPVYEDFGAWTTKGKWLPNRNQSQAVLDARRVARGYVPIFQAPDETSTCGVKTASGKHVKHVDYHRAVRVIGPEIEAKSKTWLHVDVDDDGVPEGYCLAKSFVNSIKDMPEYVHAEWRAVPQVCGTP